MNPDDPTLQETVKMLEDLREQLREFEWRGEDFTEVRLRVDHAIEQLRG